jgi:hypothetical protein
MRARARTHISLLISKSTNASFSQIFQPLKVKLLPVWKSWTLFTSLHKKGDLSCCAAKVSNHAAIKYYKLRSAPVCLFTAVSVHFRTVHCHSKPVSGTVDDLSFCSKAGRTAADPGGGAGAPA